MKRTLLLTTTVAALATAAPAEAQLTTTAAPNTAGKGTTVSFNLNGSEAPLTGKIPSSLSMTAGGGYRFNLKASPKRCSHESAILDECPAASKIGSGTLSILITQGGATRPQTFPLNAYMATNTTLFVVVHILGVRVVPGTISGSGGTLSMTFNPLPTVAFPNVTFTLETISLQIGAHQTVKVRKKKGHGKHRHFVTKRQRVDLVTNPSHCSSSWPSTFTLGFPGGTSTTVTAPIACKG